MLWIICTAASTAMLLLSIAEFVGKRGSARIFAVFACLFAATYIIYIPPFFLTYGFLSGLAGNIVNVMRVITLDADIMQFHDFLKENIASGFAVGYYMTLLMLLHITLPAVSAMSAVAVLFSFLSSMRMFFSELGKKPMFIFSEMNERSALLAESLKKVKCSIVFAGNHSEVPGGAGGGMTGCIFRDDCVSELKIKNKKGKEIYFFCISDDEASVLSHALRLIEKFSKLDRERQRYIHIYLFSRYRDYSVFIDSSDKAFLDIRCINEAETLAYNLLDKYPLFSLSKSDIHVLLNGFTQIGTAALKAILWYGQLSDYSVKISVVGSGITSEIDTLRQKCPGIFGDRYCVYFYDCQSESESREIIKQKCADADYVIVSGENDDETMDRGIELRRMFYRIDKTFSRCPPIFCYIRELSKSNILKNLKTSETNPERRMSYSLTPFGALTDIYTYERLVDSDVERLAKNIHLAYEEIFSDGEIDVKGALSRYNTFESNKRSNRASALHIRCKLNYLGLDYTDDDNASEVEWSDYCDVEKLEQLAMSEHRRWMAFLETEGWMTAEKEEVFAYRESGISKGKHKCSLLLMHPYICKYESLRELSVDLEGKDTTLYDRELVSKIPEILGDKWGIAGKKYKIIKLK